MNKEKYSQGLMIALIIVFVSLCAKYWITSRYSEVDNYIGIMKCIKKCIELNIKITHVSINIY